MTQRDTASLNTWSHYYPFVVQRSKKYSFWLKHVMQHNFSDLRCVILAQGLHTP